jgi:hypothetical protein
VSSARALIAVLAIGLIWRHRRGLRIAWERYGGRNLWGLGEQ